MVFPSFVRLLGRRVSRVVPVAVTRRPRVGFCFALDLATRSLPLSFVHSRQLEVVRWRLPRLLDEAVERHDALLGHAEQKPRDPPGRKRSTKLEEPCAQRRGKRSSCRPAPLKARKIHSDHPSLFLRQPAQPFPNRLRAMLRSVEDDRQRTATEHRSAYQKRYFAHGQPEAEAAPTRRRGLGGPGRRLERPRLDLAHGSHHGAGYQRRLGDTPETHQHLFPRQPPRWRRPADRRASPATRRPRCCVLHQRAGTDGVQRMRTQSRDSSPAARRDGGSPSCVSAATRRPGHRPEVHRPRRLEPWAPYCEP